MVDSYFINTDINIFFNVSPSVSITTQKVLIIIILYCMQSLKFGIWPTSFTLLLTSSDGDEDSYTFTSTITVEVDGSYLLRAANKHIQSKRLWNAVVLAYGCIENVLMNVIEISECN